MASKPMDRKVSTTCEQVTEWDGSRIVAQCGEPSTMAYPAMGGGYMSLCAKHGEKHKSYCVTIEQAQRGEKPHPDRAIRREGES